MHFRRTCVVCLRFGVVLALGSLLVGGSFELEGRFYGEEAQVGRGAVGSWVVALGPWSWCFVSLVLGFWP